jgi:hypothetical protein
LPAPVGPAHAPGDWPCTGNARRAADAVIAATAFVRRLPALPTTAFTPANGATRTSMRPTWPWTSPVTRSAAAATRPINVPASMNAEMSTVKTRTLMLGMDPVRRDCCVILAVLMSGLLMH